MQLCNAITAFIFFSCIALTQSIKCYIYASSKTDTSKPLDCPDIVTSCYRTHGYAAGEYKEVGACGTCDSPSIGATMNSAGNDFIGTDAKSAYGVTCSACSTDKCNSASRSHSMPASAMLSLSLCLLCLLKIEFSMTETDE
ncbi:hypothetical protein BOX15_Mlig024640g1 [Macrostomum lignano]|uniref:UPAR/Ly6 domain-containing protein n=1 Tax=Macrostomum lignano TaxID=282301 RepID=A0A267F1E1_9PLAT|nr:hypothetical protein BOX15_Mlig024640g1 [Macrostomum lignano]